MRTHTPTVLNGLLLLGLLVPSLPTARAQSAPRRIVEAVDETKLVVLRGSTRPEASKKNDRGSVPDGFRMEHMLLQLRRSPEQERVLTQLIDQLHQPKSPNFQHWLTAQEFGQRYGLAAEDLTTITGWLQSRGFSVNVVYPNGIVIDFSGTAGQVRNAFQTEIHYLDVKGARHIANMSDPQIPAALAPAVVGVVSLNDFRPRPTLTSPGPCSILSSTCYSLVASDLATIYNFNPQFTNGISGQGQTIVVLEPTDVFSTADWTTFRSTFGLSSFTSGSFVQVHPASSGTNNCDDPLINDAEGEAILDAEWASAAAPNAAIVLASCSDSPPPQPGVTTTSGVLIALQNLINAASQPPAIMSISYEACELENTTPSNAAYNSAYQQAVTEGVSVFVAAGDGGAALCDQISQDQLLESPPATLGISVNGLASTQFNVAVGGTDFEDTSTRTNSTYWNSSNTSTFSSAKSYIPEIPWNNSCASVLIAIFVSGSGTTYGANGFCNSGTVIQNPQLLNSSGGSGGPSACATGALANGTCEGTPKPSWQAVPGNPTDGVRDLPDVSLFAANGIWGHAYVVCWSDPSQSKNGARACSPGTPDAWSRFGGTSVATPIVAGIQALINQKTGKRWGNPNPTYYSLAAAQYGASGNANCNSSLGNAAASTCIFYDVTHGDMDVPCVFLAGTPFNCFLPSGMFGVLSTSNSAYQPAFGTNTGWDFATGIGTINAANLVNSWVSGASFAISSISPTSASVGTGAVSLTVNGSGFSAQSQVEFTENSVQTPLATTFISASQLIASIPASLLQAPGIAQVSVTDPSRQNSTNSVTFTVTSPPPGISTISPTSALAGGAAFTLSVSGSNFVSGSVINFNGAPQPTTFVSSTSLTAAISASSVATAGSFSVTVTNPAPNGGTSMESIFTVNNPAPVLNSISPTSVAVGSPAFTLSVSGSNFNASSVVNFNAKAVSTTFASATALTASIPATDVATAATDSVTVFNPAPGGGTSTAASFSVSTSDFVLNVAGGGNATITAGQTAIYKNAVSLTDVNGFSFTVVLSCSTNAPMSTCDALPSSLTQGTNATIRVFTTQHGSVPPFAETWRPSTKILRHVPVWLYLMLAMLFLTFATQNRRRRFVLSVPLALILLSIIFESACASNPTGGTSAGNYTVSVTGVSGTLTHSVMLGLTVK